MKVAPVKLLNDSVKKSYDICLSCSLFKMADPYRNFNKYVHATLKLLEAMPTGFFMRIYTDMATFRHPEFARIAEAPFEYFEIFIYEYPEFIPNKRLGYHDGTFGALMRFLSLWDRTLWTDYNIKYIWVSDIDISPAFLDTKIIAEMEKTHSSFGYYSNACYSAVWVNYDRKYPILAGKCIFGPDIKISKEHFNKFLRDCLRGKYKWLKNVIEEREKKFHTGTPKLRSVINGKYIIYGFDEYYTNYIMYEDIIRYRRLAQYNLFLGNLRHYFKDLPQIDEIMEEEHRLWSGQKTNNKLLQKMTDDIYNIVINRNISIMSDRMKGCLADYAKYKDQIDENSITMGAYVVLEPEEMP